MPSGVDVATGGTGTRITISPDGQLVQDFSDTVPLTATSTLDVAAVIQADETTARTYLAPTGRLTARIQLPSDLGSFTSAPVEGVDASGVGGTAWMETFGTRVDLSVTELMGIATSIASDQRFAVPTGPPEVVCGSDGTLVLRAGPQQQVYEPAGS
jgi:hypothetical protein